MGIRKTIEDLSNRLLSEKTKEVGERIVVWVAVVSFLIHLAIIGMVQINLFEITDPSKLLTSPIAAIYTPFSIILFYEVYLLVYYLPKSITFYIGKQYEIITLIIIRRIFKDLANLDLTANWFSDPFDLQFTYDIVGTLILFLFIFFFYRLNELRQEFKPDTSDDPDSKHQFVFIKKLVSVLLIPIFVILSIYSLGGWIWETYFSLPEMVNQIRDVNKVFYDDFFTVMIMTDVILLLFSFIYSDEFRKIMRNSGFVISTILIKISFSTDGLLNTLLVVAAVTFGVLILYIHNLYEKNPLPREAEEV
ncbi:MAG TPA: hypothetical protein VJ953_08645 [Saprospiraceae bacterium]|nr:hypothetical protein [Saprospiraceae bacterium]